MENQKRTPGNGDEIDLSRFFSGIGKGFSNFGRSTISGLASLRSIFYQNRLFFVGLIILGLILGAIYSEMIRKDYYKSSMVLSCDYLNTQILRSTIEKFNLLAEEKDGQGLQELLGLDNNTAKNILEFEFRQFVSEDDVVEMEILKEQLNNLAAEKKDLVEKVIKQLEIQNKDAYEITVLVYDPGIVKPLENAIVKYFRTNNYIKRRIESNEMNLKERERKLKAELRKLDSLKEVLYQNYESMAKMGRGSNNVVVGDEGIMTNPIDVYDAALTLHEELQTVQEKLYLGRDFEVVDGFTSFKEPESASLPDLLALSVLLSILVGYLILGAYRFDRMLAEYPSKHP
jgi:hypothetical protein